MKINYLPFVIANMFYSQLVSYGIVRVSNASGLPPLPNHQKAFANE